MQKILLLAILLVSLVFAMTPDEARQLRMDAANQLNTKSAPERSLRDSVSLKQSLEKTIHSQLLNFEKKKKSIDFGIHKHRDLKEMGSFRVLKSAILARQNIRSENDHVVIGSDGLIYSLGIDDSARSIIDNEFLAQVKSQHFEDAQVLIHYNYDHCKHKIKKEIAKVVGVPVEEILKRNNFNYVVYVENVSEELLVQLSKIDGVMWVGHYSSKYKVSSELENHTVEKSCESMKPWKIDSRVVTLEVWLSSHLDKDAIASVGSKIKHQLKSLHKQSTVKTTLHNLHVAIHEEKLAEAIELLSLEESVVLIDPLMKKESMNHHATWIVQSGREDHRPFFDSGVTGKGEIVGVADTGLDFTNCLLGDPDGAEPNICRECHIGEWFVNDTCKYHFKNGTWTDDHWSECDFHSDLVCDFTTEECTVKSNHSKVLVYWAYVDDLDDVDGHGTHVAGSVAGYSGDGNQFANKYKGSAPDAQLIFHDIGSEVLGGALITPNDLDANLFPHAQNLGARIHSNSWGSASPFYTAQAREIDKFSYENDEFLILIAAGNDGQEGVLTVGTPASSKNGIAVGASRVVADGFIQAVPFTARSRTHVLKYLFCDDVYGLVEEEFIPNTTFCEYYNETLYSRSDGEEYFATCDAFLEFTCGLVSDLTEESAGGHGSVCCERLTPKEGSSVALELFYAFIVGRVSCCNAHLEGPVQKKANDGLFGIDVLADFSSRGPTPDLRLKPDILAPGDVILSARGDQDDSTLQCPVSDETLFDAITSMSGTSMATPHAAGVAALVRQYLREGRYGDGSVDSAQKISKPSAALVKALMINSGIPLHLAGELYEDVYHEDGPISFGLDPFHYYAGGHGRVNLEFSLPIEKDHRPEDYIEFRLNIQERVVIQDGEKRNTPFECVRNGPFSASLVWNDPPADPSGPYDPVLINNLDLIAKFETDEDLELQRGNAYLMLDLVIDLVDQKYWEDYFFDALNNAERVLTVAPGGKVDVEVVGNGLETDDQAYSLVVRYVPCGETFSDDKTIGRSFKNATFAEIDIQVFVDQLFESIDEIAGYIEANWDHRIAVVKANHDKVKKDIIHVVFHIRDLHGVVDPADGMRAEEIVSTYETIVEMLKFDPIEENLVSYDIGSFEVEESEESEDEESEESEESQGSHKNESSSEGKNPAYMDDRVASAPTSSLTLSLMAVALVFLV